MNREGLLKAFKAYDIRGKYPSEIDEDLASALARALVIEYQPKRVVVGRDARLSGPSLVKSFTDTILSLGVDLCFIGICGTEEIYHAAAVGDFDFGLMFTASHNPADNNGIKVVRRGAVPFSSETGLFTIRDRILNNDLAVSSSSKKGHYYEDSFRDSYIKLLLSMVSIDSSYKILLNPGNGCAGAVLDELIPHIPGNFEKILWDADGTFPNGVPNPLLPERRKQTASAVIKAQADIGIAYDGDFDRCFFFDANGNYVESNYLIGLMVRAILKEHPGEKILHDTRLYWNTLDEIKSGGGVPVVSKTGHAFMKESLRRSGAIFGGEMSCHYYFRNFHCCDSGILPGLIVLELMSKSGLTLEEMVRDRIKAFPCSGEINFTVNDPQKITEIIFDSLKHEIKIHNDLDGLCAECTDWRFNIRSSNTEPLIRLNVEGRGSADLVSEKTALICSIIESEGGKR